MAKFCLHLDDGVLTLLSIDGNCFSDRSKNLFDGDIRKIGREITTVIEVQSVNLGVDLIKNGGCFHEKNSSNPKYEGAVVSADANTILASGCTFFSDGAIGKVGLITVIMGETTQCGSL